jgi:hypothetical protein
MDLYHKLVAQLKEKFGIRTASSIGARTTTEALSVSVIVPVYNAVLTIGETLESLRAQTHDDWEAVVVDDGSRDGTGDLLERFMALEPRIRPVHLASNQGAPAARNRGTEEARFDWLVFLDADDVLAPNFIERMASAVVQHPNATSFFCGVNYITSDGKLSPEKFDDIPPLDNHFRTLSRQCCFKHSAMMIAKQQFYELGGYDGSMKAAQDWDFFQRLARTGADLVVVPEVLARIRLRPGSISRQARRLWPDSKAVVMRGHGRDPRVKHPAAEHAEGTPKEYLPSALLNLAGWTIGIALGSDDDPDPIAREIESSWITASPAGTIAAGVYYGALYGAGRLETDWSQILPPPQVGITRILDMIEERTGTTGLATQEAEFLDGLVVQGQGND